MQKWCKSLFWFVWLSSRNNRLREYSTSRAIALVYVYCKDQSDSVAKWLVSNSSRGDMAFFIKFIVLFGPDLIWSLSFFNWKERFAISQRVSTRPNQAEILYVTEIMIITTIIIIMSAIIYYELFYYLTSFSTSSSWNVFSYTVAVSSDHVR